MANIVRPVKLVWWRKGEGGSNIDADVTDAAATNTVSPPMMNVVVLVFGDWRGSSVGGVVSRGHPHPWWCWCANESGGGW